MCTCVHGDYVKIPGTVTGQGFSHVHEIQTQVNVPRILGAVPMYTRAHVCIEKETERERERERDAEREKEEEICVRVYMGTARKIPGTLTGHDWTGVSHAHEIRVQSVYQGFWAHSPWTWRENSGLVVATIVQNL